MDKSELINVVRGVKSYRTANPVDDPRVTSALLAFLELAHLRRRGDCDTGASYDRRDTNDRHINQGGLGIQQTDEVRYNTGRRFGVSDRRVSK